MCLLIAINRESIRGSRRQRGFNSRTRSRENLRPSPGGLLFVELAPDKTRVMPFSRYRQDETSFEFLGFEFRWGVNRKGHAWLKRRTARKKFRTSLKRVTEWCGQDRDRRIREQVQLLNPKPRGYNNYYGVSGNSASVDEFFYHVRRIHQRWLNQRSQRRSYSWAAYTELMHQLRLEQPRVLANGLSEHSSFAAAASIHEEPGAEKPHTGICAGAVE